MKLGESKISTAVILDKRYKKKTSKKYAVKLRVNFMRERLYLNMNIDLTEAEFEKVMNQKVRGRLLDIQLKIENDKSKANEIIASMKTFNFSTFKKLMGTRASSNSLEFYFEAYISELNAQERIKTAVSYQTALNALKSFYKGKFSFHHLTPSELQRFENHFVEKGKSVSTVGVYMRSLRTIYNIALEAGSIATTDYPFGRKKYVIPSTRKKKHGLAKDFIRIIRDQEFVDPAHQYYRDLWLFSYYCNGMNMKDIAYLKFKNIENGLLSFTREKSKLTRKQNNIEVSVQLNKSAREIIDRWGNSPKDKSAYLFPILSPGTDIKAQIKTYTQVNQMVRKTVNKIAESHNWPFKVNFQTARHSFAQILQSDGQSDDTIQQSLGHSDPKSTQHYLANLSVKKLSELSSLTEL